MSPGAQVPKNRIIGKTTVRHYSACLLGALLLLFSANARLARYDVQHRDLKLATAQSYLEGDDTRLELSIAALLLLWSVAVVAIPLLAAKPRVLRGRVLSRLNPSGRIRSRIAPSAAARSLAQAALFVELYSKHL